VGDLLGSASWVGTQPSEGFIGALRVTDQ
jgi:hypothetical protein